MAVPIYFDPVRRVTRLWMTVGVRLAQLDTNYAKPPSLRPEVGSKDWTVVEPRRLAASHYVIPVDEFAEVEIHGGKVLTRAELRAICDQTKTKARIVEAIGKR